MNAMNNEIPQDLRTRTSDFALRIIRLYVSLPKTTEGQVIGKQVLRSGTSIGAHYREGYRAKSDADVVNKFETALQELDETDYIVFHSSSFRLHPLEEPCLTN